MKININNNKKCPNCGEKVPWKLILFPGIYPQKWNCPGCDSVLTTNITNRIIVGIIVFLLWVFFKNYLVDIGIINEFLSDSYSYFFYLLMFVFVLLGTLLSALFESVILSEDSENKL